MSKIEQAKAAAKNLRKQLAQIEKITGGVPKEKDLAAAVGIDDRSLRRYRQRGCTADTPEGIEQWRQDNLELSKSRSDGSDDIEAARLEKTQAEAALLWLKFQQESGLLVPAEDMQRALAQACAKAKNRLELLPHEVVRDFPQELRQELFERVELAVRAALLDLSEVGEE